MLNQIFDIKIHNANIYFYIEHLIENKYLLSEIFLCNRACEEEKSILLTINSTEALVIVPSI